MPATTSTAAGTDWLDQSPSLLEWEPGETLFSLCSRIHRLWGHARSWQTTEHLFGDRRSGTHHDLPNKLEEFTRRTQGRYGPALDLATEKTLLRYYSAFSSPPDVLAAAHTMLGPSVAHLKFRLGLLTSRFRANHPLKACLSCMRSDVSRSGWTTWRLGHQFPGVWWCVDHDEPLLTSAVKSTGVERFFWHLPRDEILVPSRPALRPPDQDAALQRLAKLIQQIFDHSHRAGWLEASVVRRPCTARMVEAGLLATSGRVHGTAGAAAYLDYCRRFESIPELSSLPSTLEMAKGEIARLVHTPRSGSHPLRMLVVINWLFPEAFDFIRCLEDASHPPSTAGTFDREAALDAGNPEDSRRPLVIELIEGGQSISAAARTTGVAVGTAMTWAAAVGIATPRRPKVLIEGVRESLILDLQKGMSKKEAATRYAVSVETVTRTLHTEVGLHRAWKEAQFNASLESTRAIWLALLDEYGEIGTKLLRSMNPAAYAWLYRNDREWLQSHTPSERRYEPNRRAVSVRWDERDRELSIAVQRTIVELVNARPARQLRLWHIYQALPELKPKLSALARLPLTRAALEKAVRQNQSSGTYDLFPASS